MIFPFNWTVSLTDYLYQNYGPPQNLVRLGGMSQSQVWRVDFATISKVIKYQAGVRELNFYQKIAPILRQRDLALPIVEQIWTNEPETWLIMEYLPDLLPQSRWLADAQQIDYLKKLHSFGPQDFSELIDYFQPAWLDAITEQALSILPATLVTKIEAKLRRIQEASQLLFEPQTAISGDPNPLNWAVRRDNELVLFDWERFSFATPALDLAITAPGLGNAALFEQIARTYLNNSNEQAVKELTRQLVLAKIWVAIEFLSFQAQKLIDQPTAIDSIVQQLPDLLELATK